MPLATSSISAIVFFLRICTQLHFWAYGNSIKILGEGRPTKVPCFSAGSAGGAPRRPAGMSATSIARRAGSLLCVVRGQVSAMGLPPARAPFPRPSMLSSVAFRALFARPGVLAFVARAGR